MSLLQLKNVSMYFSKKGKFLEAEKQIKVLRNVNLEIEQGEIVVLVGESGCGKTTIGKIITGLLRPTKGDIIFNGNNIYKFSLFGKRPKITVDESLLEGKTDKERKKFIKQYAREQKELAKKQVAEYENSVQFVQQDSYAALNPARTIYQSLYAPIQNKHRSWTKEQVNVRIEEVMSLVGLSPSEQFLYKFPHQLSGGQRQRVLMARAISLDPKLVVADEPVSMIDVSLRLSILDLMKRLNSQLNIAFVYITHDLSTARYIGQNGRICIMYLGEIVEMGKVTDVIASPKHPYTQALFSAVPVPDPVIARKRREIKLKSMDVGNLLQRKDGCPFFARCVYSHEDCEDKVMEYTVSDGVCVKCDYLSEVPTWQTEI